MTEQRTTGEVLAKLRIRRVDDDHPHVTGTLKLAEEIRLEFRGWMALLDLLEQAVDSQPVR